MMDEKSILEEWINKDWEKERGIHTIDYNNELILVRASMEEVGQTLTLNCPEAKWSRDVLDRDIILGQEGFFIFRLSGHSWTELLYHHNHQTILPVDYIERLSRNLNARVIHYFVGDTAGVIGYTLYEQGKVLENFGGSDEEVDFHSEIRNLTAENIENVWRFAHDFFVEQDALEPGIRPGYFLNTYYVPSPDIRPVQKVTVRNPGFILVDVSRKEGVSIPKFEQIDYIALA